VQFYCDGWSEQTLSTEMAVSK